MDPIHSVRLEDDAAFSFIRFDKKQTDPEKFGKLVQEWQGDQTVNKHTSARNEVQIALNEALGARNLSFLFGAGCSSYIKDDAQVGIPCMQELARELCEENMLTSEEEELLNNYDIKLEPDSKYRKNLESLMEVLYSLHFIFDQSQSDRFSNEKKYVFNIIQKIKIFLLGKCKMSDPSQNDSQILTVYKNFYRKLSLRDRSQPRPWVFTTNYDLFNEKAMDSLAIPYANGFSGVIERRFNPAMFRYTLAQQLDIANRNLSAIDNYIYLCKLHGSISWTEDAHSLYPIRENSSLDNNERMMIFPTPAKQNASLASPYAELFREFQFQIVREQSVLVTVGYGFGDEHINNIIYQSLTIPSFKLVVFADPELDTIAPLIKLEDPRIWIIGGNGPSDQTKAHYFDTFVERFMPYLSSSKIDEAINKISQLMNNSKEADTGSTDEL